MQEHPIPQDVTGYKFHIVGNMTLKQFAQVGGGVLVGVILYNTNLLPIFKWPLVIISVGLGAMMAFVPIEERPLDHWIITFIRRLYSPTKFYWRKESEVPFALQPEKLQKAVEAPPMEVDLTPARTQRIREYIESVKQPDAAEPWEESENARIGDIMQTFDQVTVDQVNPTPQAIKPQLTPRIRKLPPSPSQKNIPQRQVVFEASADTPPTAPPTPGSGRLTLPEAPPAPVLDQQPAEVFNDETEQDTSALPEIPAYSPPTTAVDTNAKLPFPQRELTPNRLMGMALTSDNKLVDRAVVNVKDQQGNVIRSLRTNVLGQFSFPDKLANGSYVISVKKDGLTFPEKTLVASGDIIEPVELRAA